MPSKDNGDGWFASAIAALLKPFVVVAEKLPVHKLTSSQTLAAVCILAAVVLTVAFIVVIGEATHSLILVLAVLFFAGYMYGMTRRK